MNREDLLNKWDKRAKNYINFAESNMGKQDPNITVYECFQLAHALAATILTLRISLNANEFYATPVNARTLEDPECDLETSPNSTETHTIRSSGKIAREALKEINKIMGGEG